MVLKEDNIWKTELLTMGPNQVWLHWRYYDAVRVYKTKK